MSLWDKLLTRQAPGNRPARQERVAGGRRVWLDLNRQVLRFEMEEALDPDVPLEPIPSVANGIVSAALLAHKAWRLDAALRGPAEALPLDAEVATPTRESGGPSWLLWTYEPLLRPEVGSETRRARFGSRYRAHLTDTVRTLLRSGGGQLAEPEPREPTPVAPLDPPHALRPLVRVEPMATHYLRRGLACRFLQQSAPQDGLDELERLYLGAFRTACEDLGLGAAAELGAVSAPFLDWARGAGDDPDIRRDAREMIPLNHGRALVVLGWTRRRLDVTFEHPPDVQSVPASVVDLIKRRAEVDWMPGDAWIPSLVVLDVECRRPLEPEDFRALADRERTPARILRALA